MFLVYPLEQYALSPISSHLVILEIGEESYCVSFWPPLLLINHTPYTNCCFKTS
jgi:hypothetical protein